ncbi:MAG: SDR family oxidoreductase [Acidimicrobiaceae bacterium]|nr:SDR family oxidoreductase [Acidimicrobiaceae bacterium]MXW77158.1 SDR family oxidoreductase [Acidimicrobiaceae bacterium]MYA74000.1 SDR family oxidoreductase [Acidimicrobiaceae bacterium]MYC42722.1 SDR family oxidoreductase [Acidimicrobiaceae bacterium]MYD06368.1 SDR family oxidoreductase [Acidimicrobiaceae bacterium]
MTGTLDGRVALVTGGRGGAGRAVCARFAAEGAFVYAADLNDAGTIGPSPAAGEFLRFDVTSEDEVAAGIAMIQGRHDRLDIVVNAAGIEIEKAIDETTLDEWNRIFAINVTGMFLTSKHALPLLRKSAHAAIINFGSYDGYLADPRLAAYCATKGAVHALTKAMACDYGPEGIRVNAICPGYIDTPMLEQFIPDGVDPSDARAEAERVHPLRTIGTPTDMANLVHWLACDEARYATGQLWVLDGGLSAQIQQMRF